MQEKIVESKQCKHCDSSFDITDKDLEFYEKASPSFWWKKYLIPTPTLCPECRQQRRLIFRNERNLYKTDCFATWKTIISMYSPDKPYKVYSEDVWWSNKWNPIDYWKEFDFDKSFFEQFKTLVDTVPHKNLINNYLTNENSAYWNFSWNNKDCYLVFEAWSLNNSYYSENTRKSNDIIDCTWCFFCDNSYWLIESYNCTNCHYCFESNNCINSEFLFNCKNCENCFKCFNLLDQKYFFENKEYTREQYFKKLEEYKKNNTNDKILSDFIKESSGRIVLYMHWFWNENCEWDYIYNSSESYNCYDSRNLENCKYCAVMSSSKDKTVRCYDYDFFWSSELSYEIITVWSRAYNVLFSINTWEDTSNIIYCYNCTWSKNCFWCFWVTYKQYCIFNKQYTKDQYEELVPKIIEHMQKTKEWWEFFPSNICPFWYNETVACEYYPLSKEESINQWFKWSDYEQPFPKVVKIIKSNMLPKDIKEIPDDILNWAIECEVTWRPFRIIRQELEFYRKNELPIPKRHPDQRHLDRMKLRTPRKLYERKCDKCGIEIKTTYSPNRPEKVYCEKCYGKEIY